MSTTAFMPFRFFAKTPLFSGKVQVAHDDERGLVCVKRPRSDTNGG